MKRLPIILQVLFFAAASCYAQKLSFDSKYIKVGVMSNEWPSCMAINPNLRNLGTLNSFDENTIGKQILDRLLQRDEKGLHMDELYDQALSNTTLEEWEIALKDVSAEAKDHLKKEVAHQLLKNNYIIKFSSEQGANGKIKKYWSVYHVEIDDRIIDQAYLNWRKPATYDQIKVPVKLVARGKVPMKAKDENELIYKIAKKVPAFAVRGPIRSRFPFVAGIGQNMGMKKVSRIYLYRFKENRHGDVYSKKVCTTRATGVSKDETRMHMISGTFPSTKKGDVAVLKDRHRSSISASGQASFGGDARYGGQLQYEHLLDFSKGGIAHYALLNVGANRYAKERENVFWSSACEEPVRPTLNHIEAQIGYGMGFNCLGRIEIMPYITGGLQYSMVTYQDMWDNDAKLVCWDNSVGQEGRWQETNNNCLGIVGYAGAKLYVNLWYPLQLSVGADYNYSLSLEGDNGTGATFKPIRNRHVLNRVNIYVGFRVHF